MSGVSDDRARGADEQLGEWALRDPIELLDDDELVRANVQPTEAWKAIRYGRAASDRYEDIAPVGHMPCGQLSPVYVRSEAWLIIGPRMALEHGAMARRLLTQASHAALRRFVVVIDEPVDNVIEMAAPTSSPDHDNIACVDHDRIDFTPRVGGVFARALQDGCNLFATPLIEESRELKDHAPAPPHLHSMLINAALDSDDEALTAMCHVFPRTIAEQFDAWRKVPPEIRADPREVQAFVHAIMSIARTMKDVGFPQLMDQLESRENNPIIELHRRFKRAETYARSDQFERSNAVLDSLLAALQPLTGNAIDGLRPKILGMLGVNMFHLDRLDEAKDITRQALDECTRLGDEAGVSAYHENLRILAASTAAPDLPLAQISKAQELSDTGRYEASTAVLEQLEPGIHEEPWTIKAFGLMGLNQYWMGDKARGAELTKLAISRASSQGDHEAVRVYRYNLSQMEVPAEGA